MDTNSEHILQKPLKNLLKIIGIDPFHKCNTYRRILVCIDILFVSPCIILTLFDGKNNRYFDAIQKLLILLLFIKIISLNIRRLDCNKNAVKIRTVMNDMVEKLKTSGFKTNTFVRNISLIVFSIMFGFRFIFTLMSSLFVENITFREKFLFATVHLLEFSYIVLKIEYFCVLLTLLFYFQHIYGRLLLVCDEESILNDDNIRERKVLAQCFFMLCDATRKCCDVMSVPIITALGETILLLSIHIHNGISKLYGSKNTDQFFLNPEVSAYCIVEYSLSLIIIILPAQLCTTKVKNIKSVSRTFSWAECKPLLGDIKLFCLHMLHEDFKVKPYGLFCIDLGLAYTIVGALTTYIIIIIQFDIMYFK